MVDINQDLLLAALVVLTDAVPRETLRSALLRWAQNPGRSVADLLLEAGVIDQSRVNALKCLVAAHLSNHNGDVQLSLDAWHAQALTQDMLMELEKASPGSTLAVTLAGTMPPTEAGSGPEGDGLGIRKGSNASSFAQDERFELIRPHAKGGIGQVWVARDRELQREVAVKEIQAKYVDSDSLKARFLLEAEITGNLEHPGIVPVYSLGRNASGRPFYAMRFIHGETLSTAIQRFHEARKAEGEKASPRSSSTWGVEFQQLLRRFLDVCDAMEYAHSRGVIHRDLKPGNIMLGEYGETLVVDWGIAKRIGKTDIVVVHGEIGEEVDFDPGVSVGNDTQPGTSIGTPSYMSPEQARGALGELGPASDVYSLGATLYELLTGTFPFPAENVRQIIARVKAGDLAPPRTLVPSLPPQLEAICLKAMAFQPAQRYQSARELALDLEHWIADEPVAAYPERSVQKVSRWLRRHRSWTYAAAVALVGISTAAMLALVLVDGARRGEESARKDAEASSKLAQQSAREAEANFKMAQQAVDDYLTNVSENTLFKEQDTLDIRTLREDLLKSALPYYEQFLKERSHDPQLREQLANAYFRLGEITRVIGSSQDAFNYYRSALELWELLIKDAPSHLEFLRRIADCNFAMGNLRESDNLPEALDSEGRALRIYESLADQDPSDARLQSSLSDCCCGMAICYSKDHQPEKCLQFLDKASAIQLRLIKDHPEQMEYKRGLARITNDKGYFYYERGEYSKALTEYNQFQRLCLDILNEHPSPTPLKLQNMLAMSYYNIATMHFQEGKLQLALEPLKQAEEYWTRLMNLHPSVTSYRFDLGTVHLKVADVERHLKHTNVALARAKQALEIFNQLVKAKPDDLEYRLYQAWAMNLEGALYDDERRNDLALPIYEQAVKLKQENVQRSKGLDIHILELCVGLENLGETFLDLDQASKALPYYEKAIALREKLLETHPEVRERATELAEALIRVGDVQRQTGELEEAGRFYDRAMEILEPRVTSKSRRRPITQSTCRRAQPAGKPLRANEQARQESRSPGSSG